MNRKQTKIPKQNGRVLHQVSWTPVFLFCYDVRLEYEEEIVVKDRKDIYFNMVTVNCVGL